MTQQQVGSSASVGKVCTTFLIVWTFYKHLTRIIKKTGILISPSLSFSGYLSSFTHLAVTGLKPRMNRAELPECGVVLWSPADVEIFTWCCSSGWFRSAALQQLAAAAAARLSVSAHTASSAVPLDTLLRLPSAFKRTTVSGPLPARSHKLRSGFYMNPYQRSELQTLPLEVFLLLSHVTSRDGREGDRGGNSTVLRFKICITFDFCFEKKRQSSPHFRKEDEK